MEPRAFDHIARLLGAARTRRAGLQTVLAVALGAAAAQPAAEAARRGIPEGGPWPAGPCGPKGKDNLCKKDEQCCTGFCKKGKKGKAGRCRCIKTGNPCGKNQSCCKHATCKNGTCTRGKKTIPTGQPCTNADTCADTDATCQAYDSDNPAGTYCLLPTGGACSGDSDCYSQDCASGACAAVSCTVCASGCPFSDLASALAAPPQDGRIKIAPGTWVNASPSEDVTQSLRIEACGGAPGVILQANRGYVFNATAGVTLTVKNIEFDPTGLSNSFLGATGTSAQAMATLIVSGCTFRGTGNYYSLYPYDYFTATVSDCTMDAAPIYAGADAVGDPSRLTLNGCVFTGATTYPVIDAIGNLDIDISDSTLSDGTRGLSFVSLSKATGATVTIAGTTISGNDTKASGGGVFARVAAGASVTIALGTGVTITGNTSPGDRGSGIAAVTAPGSTVTITGAPGKVSGNTPDPQCVRSIDDGVNFTTVADCAY